MLEITKSQKNYELLDSGDKEKLERFGDFVLRRPDPQALWKKHLDDSVWEKADAYFNTEGKKGDWKKKVGMLKSWQIEFGSLSLKISPTAFKHTGLFPEQLSNWTWMEEKIKIRKSKNEPVKVLNLFGYTGGATLACARAGAEVVHVDASKTSIEWGKENSKLSTLDHLPIRWILDDAVVFVKREIKRGNKYDGILLDPPAFGHGPKGEMWKIEEDLLPLIELTKNLLNDNPLFYLINGYASGYSAVTYKQNITDLIEKFGGNIEEGELMIEEKGSGRLLPSGIFARWSL